MQEIWTHLLQQTNSVRTKIRSLPPKTKIEQLMLKYIFLDCHYCVANIFLVFLYTFWTTSVFKTTLIT